MTLRILVLVWLIGFKCLIAQDQHLSQYFASPATLNPALTGVVDGEFRLVANYRSQWGSFAPFTTYAASVDAAIHTKRDYGSYFGFGAFFLYDAFDDLQYKSTQVGLGFSYNQLLGKFPLQYLAYGVQAGMVQRGFDINNLNFGSWWEEGVNSDPSVPGNYQKSIFADLSAGIVWYMLPSYRTNFYLGISQTHINEPAQGFLSGTTDRLQRKWSVNAGLEAHLNLKQSILPTLLFLKQGPSREMNLGTYWKYKFELKKRNAFYWGAWYRIVRNEQAVVASDAFIVGTRFDLKNVNLAFSYDLNLSRLSRESHFRGGPEISLVFISHNKERESGVRFCPSF